MIVSVCIPLQQLQHLFPSQRPSRPFLKMVQCSPVNSCIKDKSRLTCTDMVKQISLTIANEQIYNFPSNYNLQMENKESFRKVLFS